MARDYPRTEVQRIVEGTARERNIPRDDFLRMAQIESNFNELASRGAGGAKGVFQFVPGTAKAYGILGKELDPTANADAAARLYLVNQRELEKSNTRTGRPYLSGEDRPNGLDVYIAHQQGVGGYASIQSAIGTGRFSNRSTRALILNNVDKQTREELNGLPDRDLATAYAAYWQTRYNNICIPEMGVGPIAAGHRMGPHPPIGPSKAGDKGITFDQAYALSVRHDAVTYGFGSKNVDSGRIDCSGWVVYLQNATQIEINQQAGRVVLTDDDRFRADIDAAATIIQRTAKRSGILLEGNQVSRASLREGMVIGEDNGQKGWDSGRYRGIDHVTMVVRNPRTNELMVSQSRGGRNGGVELSSVDEYLRAKQARGVELYATDPLYNARSILMDRNLDQVQGQERAPIVGAHFTDVRSHVESTESLASPQGLRSQTTPAVAPPNLDRATVETLQRSLTRLGFTDARGRPLADDGRYGPRTHAAVAAFQHEQGLPATGLADRTTLSAVNAHVIVANLQQQKAEREREERFLAETQAYDGRMAAPVAPSHHDPLGRDTATLHAAQPNAAGNDTLRGTYAPPFVAEVTRPPDIPAPRRAADAIDHNAPGQQLSTAANPAAAQSPTADWSRHDPRVLNADHYATLKAKFPQFSEEQLTSYTAAIHKAGIPPNEPLYEVRLWKNGLLDIDTAKAWYPSLTLDTNVPVPSIPESAQAVMVHDQQREAERERQQAEQLARGPSGPTLH